MLSPEIEYTIQQLADAFYSSFRWIATQRRENTIDGLAQSWAEITASGLQDVRIMAPPIVDYDEPQLPFMEVHTVTTELFMVARSGMLGGPPLDLILQVWFDTADMAGGFGVPMHFKGISSSGVVPDDIWEEVRATAAKLNVATPSGKIVFVATDRDFDLGHGLYGQPDPILVMNAHHISSTLYPPHPVSGRRIRNFSIDLASGWVGDPLLSGRETSPVFDEILSNFHVGHILRIQISSPKPWAKDT